MSATRWGARRRALVKLAPYLNDDDVEAAARALAAEAGLEVTTVMELHELDGDEDVEGEAPNLSADPGQPSHVGASAADDDLADDPMELGAPAVAYVADDDALTERDEVDKQAQAERRRALLAETDELLARGRQWDELTAGKETGR
ncbi:hypothetical protein [Isoptericola sp. NPDC019482]|uniref:hypothetical protein n=1 Tax=Isoptericola sp. NPDC019482 TaxID=3154688 RepID=UPI00348F9650